MRGETRRYLLFREMLPNAMPPLIVEASVRFAYSIFLVASLGFLGLGVPPPAGAIALLVIGTSLMADGLRSVFSPRGSAGTR